MAMGVSGGFGKGKSHTNSPGKNRGPKHGHGNKGKGGGGVYGNPSGMTLAEAMKIYGVSDSASLEQRMSHNPAETISFYSLIDDSATTDDTTTTTTDDTTTTNNTSTGNNNVTTNTIGLDASGNLDLDHLYKVLLGRGPDAHTASLTDAQGVIDQSARDYWNTQFTTAGGDAAALQGVISGIQGSQEFADLGLAKDTYLTNPNFAEHRVQAANSINRGDGVRAGTIASYSDKFNTDGTVKSDWVDTETWASNQMQGMQQEIADLKANPITNTVYVDNTDTSMYDQQISDLQDALDSTQIDYDSLMQTYKDQTIGYNSLYAQAAYGDKPGNLTVKGVKTQNELPGYQTKTSGTGFFSRDKKKYPSTTDTTLKIGALNLA